MKRSVSPDWAPVFFHDSSARSAVVPIASTRPPDAVAFEKASTVELKPHKLTNTLAFMFETRYPQHLTSYAASVETLQTDYIDCWTGLDKGFNGRP